MIRAGIREFRDHATHYLGGNDVIAIERHGTVVGYYIPVRKRDEEKLQRDLAQLREAIEQAKAETGLSEDQLADLFDLSKPLD